MAGGWANDLREGAGACTYSTGVVYKGDWVQDRPHGHGEVRLPDGSVYEGQLIDGAVHGHGKMVYPTGIMYDFLFLSFRHCSFYCAILATSSPPISCLCLLIVHLQL